jgi:uncharacterized membrane protein
LKFVNISIGKNLAGEAARLVASMLLLLFLFILTEPEAQAQKWTLQRLDPPGSHYSFAFGLNNTGLVVGSFVDANNVYEGFIYNGSTYKEISQSASLTQANGVNDNNIVVGDYIGMDELSHGFFLRDGQFTSFDAGQGESIPDETSSTLSTYIYAINNAGNFVGYTQKQGEPAIAYISLNGTVKHFTFQGDYTFAYGINNNNQIVGWFLDSHFNAHGFFRGAGGRMTQIDYPGATTTVCVGINDLNEITGYYVDTKNVPHGFIRYKGKLRTAPLPGVSGINNSEVFVGSYIAKNGNNYGYIATPE